MDYYRINAEKYFEATKNADMKDACNRFLKYLKKGSSILDIGCGSGRDAAYFKDMGYMAEGLEPSEKLAALAEKHSGVKIHCFPVQDFVPEKRYDGLFACASLLHLKEKEILAFFKRAGEFVSPCAYIYASGKSGITTGVASDGRYFTEFTEELLQKILKENEHLELAELWYSDDVTGRTDFNWMNFILRYKETLI